MGTEPPFVPTPRQIEERAAAIRDGWTEAERRLRAAAMPKKTGLAEEALERLAVYPQCFHLGSARGQPIVELAAFPP